jgi:PDZ domain-containing protein
VTTPTDLREASFRRLDPPPRRDWVRIGWVLVSVALALVVLMGLTPSGYVIETPGPVYDTLGKTGEGDAAVPLIRIPSQKTYDTDGTLDLLTVEVNGTPTRSPDLLRVALAWFDPTKSVQPLESVFPPGVTQTDRDRQSRLQMDNSQQEAIAAALTELGYDIPRTLTVASVEKGSPADGVMQKGDQVVSLNGTAAEDLPALRKAVAANGTDKPAQIGILRDGVDKTLDITPVTLNGQPAVGVGVGVSYDFPFDVQIELPNVGGPSAGMMFALGIYDKLTPGALTGGEKIAGTGTIDADGVVGPIGGIRQKLYGARDAGATWFLAPKANCKEVAGHVPDGIRVVSVATLDDSLDALQAISSGSGTSGLPTCTAE